MFDYEIPKEWIGKIVFIKYNEIQTARHPATGEEVQQFLTTSGTLKKIMKGSFIVQFESSSGFIDEVIPKGTIRSIGVHSEVKIATGSDLSKLIMGVNPMKN